MGVFFAMSEEWVDELFRTVSEESDLRVAVRLLEQKPAPPPQACRKALALLSELCAATDVSAALVGEARYFRALAYFLLDERGACRRALSQADEEDARVKLLREKLEAKDRRDAIVGGV